MLNYLLPYSNNCDKETLLKIKQEREKILTSKQGIIFSEILKNLPTIEDAVLDFDRAISVLSSKITSKDKEKIYKSAQHFIPWRKGPFNLFDIEIDAEWRSDQKWDRLKLSKEEIENKVILDIGCNNGYFLFKMAEFRPQLALGIDPVLPCWAQFHFIQHFAKAQRIQFELWKAEDLEHFYEMFDLIFSMGIIYHHKDPLGQLIAIRKALRPGGTLILETIGIQGEESYALFPEDRYTKMKNIYFIPTLSCLINWAKKAKFKDIEVISMAKTTKEEQRLTSWCPPPIHNFSDFLNPDDEEKTIEGYPAPYRFALKMKKL